MTATAPAFRPDAAAPEALERAIAEAESEVKRIEQAIIDAPTPEQAQAARDALTRAEIRLYDLLDQRPEGCACEGWPRGK